MSIQKSRRKAEEALGEKFNIRAFHDSVLELGSVPLPVLEEHIDRFIQAEARGLIRTWSSHRDARGV